MNLKKIKIIIFCLVSVLVFGADFGISGFNYYPPTAQAAASLRGRFLIQVEDRGQAWYVNPSDNRRYLLAKGGAAVKTLGILGLGVSNKDWAVFQKMSPRRLAGRVLLKVEDKGQAYYLSPRDFKLYPLTSELSVLSLVKSQGLGVTNKNLSNLTLPPKVISPKITPLDPSPGAAPDAPISRASTSSESVKRFSFKYKNTSYDISQTLSSSLYNSYKNSPKVYTYFNNTAPSNLRESFYSLFFNVKSDDYSLDNLLADLRAVATQNNWSDDELLEFTLALVQYLPYDQAKVAADSNRNISPYYPYETLYLGRGVCSDKTFLAVALLRKLGYGAAILDFPEINHSALGVACPTGDSLNGSGYCYVETTNYFPLGVIPQSISPGKAQNTTDEFSVMFNSANLGQVEIYQKTSGRIYKGLTATRAKIEYLQFTKTDLATKQTALTSLNAAARQQETDLSQLKVQMDNYYKNGQSAQYNDLVSSYNSLVKVYNDLLTDYQLKVNNYNQTAREFNQAIADFYQK